MEGQTSLAVSLLLFILLKSGLFRANKVTNLLRIWSDGTLLFTFSSFPRRHPGGPHHFKTKEHFYFLTTLLLYFQHVERYFFLAHFGRSAVDHWFGAMKQRVRSDLTSF